MSTSRVFLVLLYASLLKQVCYADGKITTALLNDRGTEEVNTLLTSSAFNRELDSSSETNAVPLERKADKSGGDEFTDTVGDQTLVLKRLNKWYHWHLGTLAISAPVNIRDEPIFDWHVSIYSKLETPYKQICGGSLVTKNTAISAAHCFWDEVGLIPAEQFAVTAGRRFRTWGKLQIHQSNVSEIIVPPRFLGIQTNFQDDIAVVKLATIFKYQFGVRPLCVNFDLALERKQLVNRNLGTITGFGLTSENGEPSEVLNFQQLPFVDIRDCIAASDPGFLKYLTSDKICAGDQDTGRALCRGDSGGGLVFFEGESTTKIPYLRGVASAAPRSNNKCNAFAIGSFTHVRTHRTFLRDHIPGLEEECRIVYAEQLAAIKDQNSENKENQSEGAGVTESLPPEGLTSIPSDVEDKVTPERANPQYALNTQKDSYAKADASQYYIFNINEDNQKASPQSTSEYNLEEHNSDSKETEDPVDNESIGTKDPVGNEGIGNEGDKDVKTLPKLVPQVGESSAPEYQWHVTVYSKAKRPYEQICGGTLVKTDVFISAANCFYSKSRLLAAHMFAAAAGKLHRPWGDPRDEYAQYSDIKRLYVASNFLEIKTMLRSCYQHDVAIATLATPVTYAPGVRPACVDLSAEFDRLHIQPGSFGKFVGYGRPEHSCEPYSRLFYRELPYVHLGCHPDFTLPFVSEKPHGNACTELVALLNNGRLPDFVKAKAPCNTDSGGGLVFIEGSSSDIVPYLRGIATAIPEGNKCDLHIIDSFLHLRDEREFLNATIPGLEKECDIAYPVANSGDAYDVGEEAIKENRPISEGAKQSRPNNPNVGVLRQNGLNRPSGLVPVSQLQPDLSTSYDNANGVNRIDPSSNGLPNVIKPIVVSHTKPNPNNFQQSSTEKTLSRRPNNELPNGVQFTGNTNIGLHLLNTMQNLESVPFTDASKVLNKTSLPIHTWEKKNKTTTQKPTEQFLRVTAAKNSNGSSFWWHVGVYSKAWSPYLLICGGSLVKRDVVLSAANCFWNDDLGALSPSRYAVAAGKLHRQWTDSRDKEAQYSDVRELIFPDRFLGIKTNYQDDIAVVRLSTPLEYGPGVRPVCVDFDMAAEKQETRSGRLGTLLGKVRTFPQKNLPQLAGWGLTENKGQSSQRLNYIELPFVDVKECIRDSAPALLKYITSDKICAGDQETGKYLCRSDSGGGLVSSGTRPVLRGIAAHAHDNLCLPVTLMRFTQVASHAMFLKEHVEDIEKECVDIYGMGDYNVEDNRSKARLDGFKGFNNLNLVCSCNCDNSGTPRYRP